MHTAVRLAVRRTSKGKQKNKHVENIKHMIATHQGNGRRTTIIFAAKVTQADYFKGGPPAIALQVQDMPDINTKEFPYKPGDMLWVNMGDGKAWTGRGFFWKKLEFSNGRIAWRHEDREELGVLGNLIQSDEILVFKGSLDEKGRVELRGHMTAPWYLHDLPGVSEKVRKFNRERGTVYSIMLAQDVPYHGNPGLIIRKAASLQIDANRLRAMKWYFWDNAKKEQIEVETPLIYDYELGTGNEKKPGDEEDEADAAPAVPAPPPAAAQ